MSRRFLGWSGDQHRGTRILTLIDEMTVTVTCLAIGEILSEHHHSERSYWSNTNATPGRWLVTPQERPTSQLTRDLRAPRTKVRVLGRYLNSGTEAKKVRDLCKRAGSELIVRSPAAVKPVVVRLPSEVKVEIARRYQTGARPVDPAREDGISEWRVQEVRKRFGLRKHPIGMSNDEIDVAVLLFGQGLSFNKIGARVGRDPKTVAKKLRLRGVAP